MARSMLAESLNVFGARLERLSTPSDPISGFFRNGFCETGPQDRGSHTVGAIVTDEFLNADQGNDLRSILKPGCRWCLCSSRWKEAFDARGQFGDAIVPKVILPATHQAALKTISIDELKQFDAAAGRSSGSGPASGEL